MTTRARISGYLEDALFLEPAWLDEAIVGVAERAGGMAVVAYDRTRVIDAFVRNSDMTREDAEEWFEFNTIGAWVGDGTPVFIDTRYAE